MLRARVLLPRSYAQIVPNKEVVACVGFEGQRGLPGSPTQPHCPFSKDTDMSVPVLSMPQRSVPQRS